MLYLYKPPYELKASVWVFPPTDEGKELGYDILERVLNKWAPPEQYYHFRNGGHVKAIHDHKQNDIFCVADIKSFFNSTTLSMVVRGLKKIGFSYAKANSIAHYSTVNHVPTGTHKFIPYGFVQSALLATLCLEHSYLGEVIRGVLKTDLLLSVYMDDIIISGTNAQTALLTDAYKKIERVATTPPYQLNTRKSLPPAPSIKVFNTELSHDHVRIMDERMDDFKAALDEYKNVYAIEAVIKYVDGLNTAQSEELEDHIAKK